MYTHTHTHTHTLYILFISGELIVSRYVAESITTDAGRFGHVGLCQLRTKLCFVRYVSAHDQFARYRQRCNEPLRHYTFHPLYYQENIINIYNCVVYCSGTARWCHYPTSFQIPCWPSGCSRGGRWAGNSCSKCSQTAGYSSTLLPSLD